MATLGKLPIRGFEAGNIASVITRGFHSPGGVIPPVGPPNGTCATAIDVTGLLPYSISLDTTNAPNELVVSPSCDANGRQKSVWWKITNTASTYQLVIVQTPSTTYYPDISAWTGASCGALSQVQCSKDSYVDNNYYFTFAAAPFQSYWILVLDDDHGLGGTLNLTIDTFQSLTGNLIVATNDGDVSQFLTAFSS